jgi:hypothetical protein
MDAGGGALGTSSKLPRPATRLAARLTGPTRHPASPPPRLGTRPHHPRPPPPAARRPQVAKLEADVRERGLALLVFGEWYNVDSMAHMRFFDDNTRRWGLQPAGGRGPGTGGRAPAPAGPARARARAPSAAPGRHPLRPGGLTPPPAAPPPSVRSWWTPATGGANVPALNELLAPLGAAFGDVILQGSLKVAAWDLQSSYGANIAQFPAGGCAAPARPCRALLLLLRLLPLLLLAAMQ